MLKIIVVVYVVWNIAVFLLYGADKQKAKHGEWRISEAALLAAAAAMGGIGAGLGMRLFHHKTKHQKFRVIVPLAIILNITIIVAAVYFSRLYT